MTFLVLCSLPGFAGEKSPDVGKSSEDSAKSQSDDPRSGAVTGELLRDLFFAEKDPKFSFPERKKRYFYHGLRNSKSIALTFDDGPHPRYTPALLKVLEEKDVPATFFMLGENVKYYPGICRRVVKAGHEVGNHSFTHPNMRNISPEEVRKEIESTQEQILEAADITPIAIRLPYGISNNHAARTAFENRLDIFFWSIDTHDWKSDVTSDDIVDKALKEVKGGSIILMHDKSAKVIDAVKELIDSLREKGYSFVTCSELAEEVRKQEYYEKKE